MEDGPRKPSVHQPIFSSINKHRVSRRISLSPGPGFAQPVIYSIRRKIYHRNWFSTPLPPIGLILSTGPSLVVPSLLASFVSELPVESLLFAPDNLLTGGIKVMGSICRFARYSRISPLSFDSHDFVRWHFIGYLLSRRGKFDCKVELCTGKRIHYRNGKK